MKDAQKPDHISLNTLLGRLREGRFVIPDFQREFEWRPADIADLVRSIFRDYYIGSLLLWRGKKENFEALACEPLYASSAGNGNREHIVLDGQQRLTAMNYAFFAPQTPLPNRRKRYLYFIRVDRFGDDIAEDAFPYDWTRYGEKLLASPTEQYRQHMFPLAVIGKGGFELFSWIQGYRDFWSARRSEADAAGDSPASADAERWLANGDTFALRAKEIVEQYQVSYIELDRDLEVAKVCDIFTQINSRGVQLDVFDLMNALLKPRGLQLKHLWRTAAPRLSFVGSPKLNVYILQVMSILRQAYCSPQYLYNLVPGQAKQVRDPDGTRREEVLIADVPEFQQSWADAVKALEHAIALLRHPQEFGVASSRYLPYVSILPVFAALQHYVNGLPPARKLEAQRKVRHWYWASVFTSRYSGSVESTSARDFMDVRAWIGDDSAEPGLIQEFAHRFRNLELRKETKRGTSIYNGIFNLLVLRGARDWMTGNVPQQGDLDDHHIVPKAWASKHLKPGVADTILNRSPLTEETNRHVIRDRLPNDYLPELIANSGEKHVRAILESHFISPKALEILLRDSFGPDDFDAFISERQRTIQDAIESLLIKERLHLPPALQELDQQVEEVELRLRDVVRDSLEDDPSLVPATIVEKVEDRLQRALRKNPAMDAEHYESLGGQLEYFDLRELEATIVNKPLWPRFAVRFSNKEALIAKFGQLADLRNAIRHSRTVDPVTAKEGEAAILWFRSVLRPQSG